MATIRKVKEAVNEAVPMADTLISLETAKLAKEKGFNEPCYAYYSESRDLMDHISNSPGRYNVGEHVDILAAPTQSLLAKWLRDRGIHVWVYPHLGTEVWYTGAIWEVGSQAARELNNFDSSYEEALEEGLFQALKLIK